MGRHVVSARINFPTGRKRRARCDINDCTRTRCSIGLQLKTNTTICLSQGSTLVGDQLYPRQQTSICGSRGGTPCVRYASRLPRTNSGTPPPFPSPRSWPWRALSASRAPFPRDFALCPTRTLPAQPCTHVDGTKCGQMLTTLSVLTSSVSIISSAGVRGNRHLSFPHSTRRLVGNIARRETIP